MQCIGQTIIIIIIIITILNNAGMDRLRPERSGTRFRFFIDNRNANNHTV